MVKSKTHELIRSIAGLFTIAVGIVYLAANPNDWPLWAIIMAWTIIGIGVLLLLSGKPWEYWPSKKVTQKAAGKAPPDLPWYTLDAYQHVAPTDLEDGREYRGTCLTLAESLRAASAQAHLTQWGDGREKVGMAVRAWLVSQHGMTAQEAGLMPVSAIIGLLNPA